jgi:hypothetical protein
LNFSVLRKIIRAGIFDMSGRISLTSDADFTDSVSDADRVAARIMWRLA